MGYLRKVHPPEHQPSPETLCLEFYERELDYLFETLQRLGASSREIEDLAQEIFVVLHRKWPTLALGRPLRPYLFAVAFRVVCAHRRRRKREILFAQLETEGPTLGPEGTVQSRESVRLLMAALETIPLPRRAVVIMHDLDGISIFDVAEKLSISRFGAYARLRKARKELASALRRLLREGVGR
jgi:RNA polymerase sigma-70 factor (ECF subfamily)